VRTWDRAERIHLAMCARGFVGDFNAGPRTSFGVRELAFVAACSAAFVLLRIANVVGVVGGSVVGAAT
jgi:cobalt/nickel transport system permease protein